MMHIVDTDIKDEISPECFKGFVQIVERCLDNQPKHHTTMAEVVSTLESLLSLQQKTNDLLQAAGKTKFGTTVYKFSMAAIDNNLGMEFGFRMPEKRKLFILREKFLQQNGALSFRKKPIDRKRNEDDINLSKYFLKEAKENQSRVIVDRQVLEEATDEQLSATYDLVYSWDQSRQLKY
ncbi:hypothetical protein L1987_54461 [Smallanthus sonchifolius]|uniref:Uncharacterized protein n=1 Tax=Smallanthus sonchifolius TaxID=185202 RepID=A0ACB9E6S8_9ASTR|nr:hypothetical protein L1987_54461 [Smallanthus sonchifolius]